MVYYVELYLTIIYCAVPENTHTPPTEGNGISRGWRFCKTKTFKAMYEA